jgi:predicted MFS family arabinose efflux permease
MRRFPESCVTFVTAPRGIWLVAMDADQGTLKVSAGEGRRSNWLDSVTIFLLGAGTSWSAGDLGPVVGDVADEFGITLAAVGLLSGTILFSAVVVALLLAPRLAEKLGLTRALALAAAVGGVGSLLFAISDSFAVASIGRVLAGLSLGAVAGLAPVLGRLTKGVSGVGLFGASFQFGIGLGLGAGSLLADSGVDWRVGFLLSAAAHFSSVPFVLREHVAVERHEAVRGFIPAALRSARAWRLMALFMAMFAAPLTLGAWFVHYVSVDGSVAAGLAGVLAFVLFAASGVMREVGGKLAGSGVPQPLLTGAAPALATVGLVAMALEPTPAVVSVAVFLMAAGFAIPYATMMVEAQGLFPAEPARPTSFFSMIGTALAIPIIPVLGGILDGNSGELAFVTLGLLVLVAGILNIKPAGEALEVRERPAG